MTEPAVGDHSRLPERPTGPMHFAHDRMRKGHWQ